MKTPGEREQELEFQRRAMRPDGTRGGPQVAPWARWATMAKADMGAAILLAVATLFCAGAVLRGPTTQPHTGGFNGIAPIVAAVFFVALIAMFLERERHGIARTLTLLGSAALVVGGIVYVGRMGAAQTIFFYWVPAILGLCAAAVLARGHKLERAVVVRRRTHRPL